MVRIDGQPWFVGKDACRGVGIKDHTSALRVLDESEKHCHIFETSHGLQPMTIISEAALYYVVLRSHAACRPGTVAHKFRKWVTTEVLPQIRKTGSYGGATDQYPLTLDEFKEMVRAYNVLVKISSEWRRHVIGLTGRPVVLFNQFANALKPMMQSMEAIEPPDYKASIAA
jgi:prophage antirepressor-like protein